LSKSGEAGLNSSLRRKAAALAERQRAERAQQQLEQERQLREEPLKRLQERGINDDL